MFKSRTLCNNLRVQLYRTAIRPVVMYGCSTRHYRLTLFIFIFERKIFRSNFGLRLDAITREPRTGNYEEIKGSRRKPNIVDEIRKRRLSLADHAWWKVGSLIHLVQCGIQVGRIPIRRPRLR